MGDGTTYYRANNGSSGEQSFGGSTQQSAGTGGNTVCKDETGQGYGNRYQYDVIWDLGTLADADLQAELAVDNDWGLSQVDYANENNVSFPTIVHISTFSQALPADLHVTYTCLLYTSPSPRD